MKFKTIFIIFNTIIGVSFVILFILPFIFLEISQFSIIFSTNWIILCIFLLFIIIFNTYFVKNWKLFKLIEKENWENLIIYLEKKTYEKKKYSKSNIKMLINCYIVMSKIESVEKLYSFLYRNKKQIIYCFPLEFGIPFLLTNSPEESEKYFKELLEQKNVKEKNWINWNYAFSLMRQDKKEGTINIFSELMNEKMEPILNLLTLYMYYPLVKNNPDKFKNVLTKISEFLSEYSPVNWEKYLEKEKKNIQAIILSKIIVEAAGWIFNLNKKEESETLQ